MRWQTLFCVVILLVEEAIGLNWLALGLAGTRVDRNRPSTSCRSLKGLNKRQIKFCRQYPLLMESIRHGAASACTECQYQFHKRRWNCTLLDPETRQVLDHVLLSEGTRESAFVHAISAAGVAYKVTRDCAKGLNGDHCGCDHSKKMSQGEIYNHRETGLLLLTGSFVLSWTILAATTEQEYAMVGCSDHVQYGIGISREFVDAAERIKNATDTAAVNLHNNRAGRQVLEKSLKRECKCHGMSGSCEMKTCWDALPTFREIGLLIKDKFDGASEVAVVEDEDFQPRLIMKNNQFKRHTNADLVYSRPSPDYCDADAERGILGTRGRECNATSQGVDGCQLLCCNRGFERRVSIAQEQCNCKFHYCCEVKCDQCERRVERHFCL